MSFQNRLDGLLNKGKERLNQYTHPSAASSSQPQPSSNYNYNQQSAGPNGPPPPIPYHSKPGRAPAAPYWQPNFHPSTPISQLFEQETGDHGWGNNESQNYTSDTRNCFFTPDGKLVLRGIVEASAPSNKYTSARLVSHQKLDRQRGCVTAVLTAPCAQGIWPAFWLLPAKPFTWPNDGEVDIFESWNGDRMNHSCLHWGHYNGEDWNKHRVQDTPIHTMDSQPHIMAFAWEQPETGQGGRMLWYIDGVPAMRAEIPVGIRRMSDWRIIMNVAMGGNVCGGKLPADGWYDFVVHELKMSDEPVGGWGQFAQDWERTKEGKAM